jgi:hypothetical protein
MLALTKELKTRFATVAPIVGESGKGYGNYSCKQLRTVRLSWKTRILADYESKLEIRSPEKRGGVPYVPVNDASVFQKHLSSIPALNWARANAHGSKAHDAYQRYMKADAIFLSTRQDKKPAYRKRLAAALALCLQRLEWLHFEAVGGPAPTA